MVYVLLANGFEEIEAIEPIDIMRRAGIEVKTASITENKKVTGSHNISVEADITIEEIDKNNIELLMLPGGPGHTNLDQSKKVQDLIDFCVNSEIYVSAICASPSILGKKGLLDNKNATCFPSFEKYMPKANCNGEKAVCDGKFITARGAGCAKDFGFLMVSILKGEKKSKELFEDMQYC